MSTFGCRCGNRIYFNVVPCRYDGEVFRDTGTEVAYDTATKQMADFFATIQEGRRDDWLRQFYSYGSTFEITDDSVVSEIMDRHFGPLALGIHQCERCGRVWLQRPGKEYFTPYLPEGDWRGALETPSEGFMGYIEGQDFFGMRIVDVRQKEGLAWVTLIGDGDSRTEVAFTGVTAVRLHDGATDKRVRFLSEWADALPLRRFLFDSTDQHIEPLLEVTAREVRP